jgi:hypothetical protein
MTKNVEKDKPPLPRRRLVPAYRTIAVVILNIVLLLVLLELVAAGALAIATSSLVRDFLAQRMDWPNDIVAHHYLKLSYYTKQQWAAKYWQEHRLALRKTYHPYVLWRSPPFVGETLNVDKAGIRHTPGSECGPDSLEVFFFGGSAMWGWGAPDWGTIPAYLHAEIQSRHDQPVCVVNFAEQAYVSTQSVIQLQLLLQAGRVPDIVIFYDGVNEVLAASQSGKPVVHQNLADISMLFQNPQHPLSAWVKGSNLVRFTRKLLAQLRGADSGEAPGREVGPEQLAGAVARAYLANHDSVRALGEVYGFEHYFVWQPYILAGNKTLTSEEKSMQTDLNWVLRLDSSLVELFAATYSYIEQAAEESESIYYLAGAFDGIEAELWIDTWGHVNPLANRIVAQQLLGVIEIEAPLNANKLSH